MLWDDKFKELGLTTDSDVARPYISGFVVGGGAQEGGSVLGREIVIWRMSTLNRGFSDWKRSSGSSLKVHFPGFLLDSEHSSFSVHI